MGPPSATISYLSEELYTELTGVGEETQDLKPILVKNKFSPINNYLAMQKAPRINSHLHNISPAKLVKHLSPAKSNFSPAKQTSHVSDTSPHSSPLKNILEFVPRRSSRSSNSSSCSDVICDGSGSSRDSSPVQVKPFNLPKMARLTELKTPTKSKSPAKAKMGNSPKRLINTAIRSLNSPSKVSSPTKPLLNSPKNTNSLISMTQDATKLTAKPPEILKTDELVLNKSNTATSDASKKVTTPKKQTPKSNKGSPAFKITPKPSICRALTVEYSSDSSEGPLSDIDDILTGNINDVEKHPMANLVFDPSNPFLDQVLERMSADDDEMSNDEADASTEKKIKKKRKRKNDIKMSPRKSLLLKQTQDKLTVDDVTPKSKNKPKIGVIKQLPITERQIYHGRNWTPMTKYGDGESEADCECSWVSHFTKKRLEDITDVNGAEKNLMNMWNVHVAKYQGRGVMHLDKVLKDFLSEHSHTLIELNLYRNFVSHISSMQQASLISMDTMLYCANAMQEVMKVISETKTVIGKVWKEQRNKQVEKDMKKLEAEKMSRKNTKSVSPSRKPKSSTRGRPNSNLPGSSLNACRSPSRGTPLSPSRPSSISRGRRPANRAVNMQKSLNFDPNSSSDATNQKFNEVTPVKQKPHRSSPRKSTTSTPSASSSSLDLRLSDSTETGSSDSFHSTKEQELSTFLNNFPSTDPTVSSTPSDCNPKSSNHISAIFPEIDLEPVQQPPPPSKPPLDLSSMIHALTDDPYSDSEDELYFSPCATPTNPAEESTDTIVEELYDQGPRLLPVYSRPRIEKDYKKLQENNYERIKALAMEKEASQKVLVLYIDDSMIEKVRSLSTYINYKYNRAANVLIENIPLPVDVTKRKRAGSFDQSERSTPDLEVSFPLIDGSPMTSYTSSPNTSNSSVQHCSGGKYGKKRKLRLHGDTPKHTQLVEQLEKSAQLVKEVKSGIMRQTTPTQDLMDI
eukprot:TRINITY_DN2336_c0_g1_i1.p1 TRINITY_DN2336_c0_g1~~TRINITY_DN2336_c0_g1_i1.p1  ORF type:complete len:1048 (-),score=339.89 TRINITY_DN2336_c0_g1_i1:321-3224(-)